MLEAKKLISIYGRRGDYVKISVYDICLKEYYLNCIEFFQIKHENNFL